MMNKLFDVGLIFPYWQYLSGETHFQWKPPAASSDLTHFRKRIGKKGAERLLKLSIDLFNPKIQKEEVVIDTTVQETLPIPPIPNWPKKSFKPAGTLRIRKDSFKKELFESYPPTPSSGIEPEKSGAENKSQEGNPKTQTLG